MAFIEVGSRSSFAGSTLDWKLNTSFEDLLHLCEKVIFNYKELYYIYSGKISVRHN